MRIYYQLPLIILVVVLGIFVAVPKASAHAAPIQYIPEASSKLQIMPDAIQIEFSERLEPSASGITVYRADGTLVQTGKAIVDTTNPRLLTTVLPPGDSEIYTVSWHVVSADDGHFTKGAFSFGVGVSAESMVTAPAFAVVHASTALEGLSVFLELLGQALLVGSLIIYAWIYRPLRTRIPSIPESQKRYTVLVTVGIKLILVGTLLYVGVKAEDIATSSSVPFFTGLQSVIQTTAGSFTLYRSALALLFGIIFFFSRKKIFSSQKKTYSELALWGVLALIIFFRAKVSHAAASFFFPNISILINAVHLAAKEMWIGGGIALLTLFSAIVRKEKNAAFTGFITSAFSKIVMSALAIGGITGVYVVWLHLKDFAFVFTTGWGILFVLLTLMAGVLLAIRLYIQFRLEPRLLTHGRTDTRQLGIALPWETAVGMAVFMVSSFLIITTPPHITRSTFEKETISEGTRITLSEKPNEDGLFLLTFEGKNAITDAIVTATETTTGIGPLVIPLEERFPGGYVFSESFLAPPGTWELSITGRKSSGYDTTAAFSFVYPDAVTVGTIAPEDRRFGFFETVMFITALSIGFGAWILHKRSELLHKQFEERVSEKNIIPSDALLYEKGAWLFFPLILLLLYHIALGHGAHAFLKTPFQYICERNGGLWHEQVPLRDGKAVSEDALLGCMIDSGSGAYHFTDVRELQYFVRLAE